MKKLKIMISSLLILFCSVLFSQEKHNKLSNKEKKAGYQLLYDGYSSSGWRSVKKQDFPESGWDYKNGDLKVSPIADPAKHIGTGGDIVTIKKYKYFDLQLEFNITEGGNSGLKYFVTNEKGSSVGLELQLLDDKLNSDAKAGKEGSHTSISLYDMIAANKPDDLEKKPGNWNAIRLLVYPDQRVEHHLNGKKVLSYIKGSQEFKKLISESKYKSISGFAENTSTHL